MKPRSFTLSDWVLQKATLATKDPIEGKLGLVWEGPYYFIKCHYKGTYHLESTPRKMLLRPWNAEHLYKVLSVTRSRIKTMIHVAIAFH
jgi:hypothetical protein